MGAASCVKLFILISCAIFVIYLAYFNTFTTPNVTFSNPLPAQSSAWKVSNSKSTFDSSGSATRQQSDKARSEDTSTDQGQKSLQDRTSSEKDTVDLHKTDETAKTNIPKKVPTTGEQENSPVVEKTSSQKATKPIDDRNAKTDMPKKEAPISQQENTHKADRNGKATTTSARDSNRDMTVDELTEELKRKIEAVPPSALMQDNLSDLCGPDQTKVYGCGAELKCKFRTQLPESYRARIVQLVQNPRLQIQPDHLKAIQSMSAQFKKRPKFLIVTGASSNHYLESQAMLYHVHKIIPTDIKYEVILYDLGLSDKERSTMKEFCNCTVIVFPFSAFPEHVSTLHCYGWKAPIIYAHSQQADVVMWSDASIRFRSSEDLRITLLIVKERGLLQQSGGGPVAKHTNYKMFHYFGDEPCAYTPFKMRQSGAGFYHNEPLIRQAVLTPWAACALTRACVCPENWSSIYTCSGIGPRWERPYSSCHRYDQSAINVVLAKLFQKTVNYVTVARHRPYDIKRAEKAYYFDYLNKTRLGLPTDSNGPEVPMFF